MHITTDLYKIVYMLKEIEGIGISEISQCLDLTNTNVKVRLHRARVMLRDSILTLTDHSSIYDFGNSKCDQLVANVMDYIFKTHQKR